VHKPMMSPTSIFWYKRKGSDAPKIGRFGLILTDCGLHLHRHSAERTLLHVLAPTRHVRPPGFIVGRSVCLGQPARSRPQPKRRHNSFEAVAKNMFVRMVLADQVHSGVPWMIMLYE